MRTSLEMAIQEVVDSYIGLYAEHQRLMALPRDSASSDEQMLKAQEHLCRVEFALEQVLQNCKTDKSARHEASAQDRIPAAD